ncbi:MAG: phosphoribosylglycinamide formyltransferase [Acidobacteria bacterium]|jgi:phosphoribosylglycinamide formyltransferase 1|nr:phosphoribosylglycinamide formyltransferase [Acidobacteriota bacterium]
MADCVGKTPIPLGILISGRGSNMRAIVEAVAEGRLGADVRVVISNRDDAPGLVWARAAGLDTLVVSHRDFATRDAYDQALVVALTSRGVHLVCLAGFMRLLGPTFCEAFPRGVLNVHPSLLPSFPGVDAQAQALTHGVKVSGVTVHFVTPELDAGPILHQVSVPVRDDDTAETLSARILVEEHRAYPEAIQRVVDGHCRVEGRRVIRGACDV